MQACTEQLDQALAEHGWGPLRGLTAEPLYSNAYSEAAPLDEVLRRVGAVGA